MKKIIILLGISLFLSACSSFSEGIEDGANAVLDDTTEEEVAEDSTEGEAETEDTAKQESEQVDEKELNEAMNKGIEDTYNFMMENEYVEDIYIGVEDRKISLAIITPAFINQETASSLADSALRQLATNVNIYLPEEKQFEKPSGDSIGGLYDHFDMIYSVGASSDYVIQMGSKDTNTPNVHVSEKNNPSENEED